MVDEKKVLKGLEACKIKKCVLCPFTNWTDDNAFFYECTSDLAQAALELIEQGKDQEDVQS